MGLLTGLVASLDDSYRCVVKVKYDDLDPDDQAEFDLYVKRITENRRVRGARTPHGPSSATLSADLKARGIDLTQSSIQKHIAGSCACRAG